MIKILLVDDHGVVLAGLSGLLAGIKKFEVVAKLSSGEEALAFVKNQSVDVIFMDISMPGMGGLEATRRILRVNSNIHIIILSTHGKEPYPYHLMRAGAKGYLSKQSPIDEIVKAVNQVTSGKHYFDAIIGKPLTPSSLTDPDNPSPFTALSPRQLQVVSMLIKAKSIADIAETLNVSKATISTYRYRLFDKLGVKNYVELIQLAARYNLLEKAIDVN